LILNSRKRFFVFLLLLGTGAILLVAQSKRKLESKHRAIVQEIKKANKALNQTKIAKEKALDEYLELKSQIKSRESVISQIHNELDNIEGTISENQGIIAGMQEDIQKIKEGYGNTLRGAYRLHLTHSDVALLWSANNLNHFFERWVYLKQYHNFRKEQARLIQETSKVLQEKIEELGAAKVDKGDLLSEEEQTKSVLDQERKVKDKVVSKLSVEELRLKDKIEEKERIRENVNKSIQNLIQEELFKREEADRKKKLALEEKRKSKERKINPENTKSKKSKTDEVERTEVADIPEDSPLDKEFASNKGKLPWPVRSGVVEVKYGRQRTEQGADFVNKGIDIRTSEDAEVFSIFEGEVIRVLTIPGFHKVIAVRHGKYIMIYAKMEDVFVQAGQKLTRGFSLGKVAKDPEKEGGVLHFELWETKHDRNPLMWLASR
jgi:murein hydrolase activator